MWTELYKKHFLESSVIECQVSKDLLFGTFKIHLIGIIWPTYKTKSLWQRLIQKPIGNLKVGVCLQLHGHVSWQPKRCHSVMLDPKGRSFCCYSGSLYAISFSVFSLFTVVNFQNEACVSTSSLSSGSTQYRNGTCFTSR